MDLTISEVKARNAYTLVITDCYHKLNSAKIDDVIHVPNIGKNNFIEF
jgi:hypothetical protein